ncbi:MAG: PilW family protein [bacterium]
MSTRKSIQYRGKSTGTSLIELMISQTIGLVVIGAVLSLVAPSISGFATNVSVSNLQESGRIALEELDLAIRQSGYHGCNPAASRLNVVNTNHPDISEALENWAYADYRIKGFDAEDAESINSVLGHGWQQRRLRHADTYIGDMIQVRQTKGSEFRVVHHDPVAQTISFEGDLTDQLVTGQILELNDCFQATTLQIDRDNSPEYRSLTNSTIVRYGSDETVNCAAVNSDPFSSSQFGDVVLLGGNPGTSCESAGANEFFAEYQFLPGTTAHIVVNSIYYIGRKDDAGDTYLYRTGPANDGASVYTEALVEGVENLRFLYGIDLDENETPDVYHSAAWLNNQPDLWAQVVSVKTWLMLNSVTTHSQSEVQPSISFPDRTGEMFNCSQPTQISASICPPPLRSVDEDHFYNRRVIEKEIYIRNSTL